VDAVFNIIKFVVKRKINTVGSKFAFQPTMTPKRSTKFGCRIPQALPFMILKLKLARLLWGGIQERFQSGLALIKLRYLPWFAAVDW